VSVGVWVACGMARLKAGFEGECGGAALVGDVECGWGKAEGRGRMCVDGSECFAGDEVG